MQWKFWQRWRKGSRKDDARGPESAALTEEKDSSPVSSLLSQSSAQEILGLQRLVGNQAVLQMVTPRKDGAEGR